MRTRLSLANALVLIDLGLHRLSRIAVHDACAFGLRCATQGVPPFAFDRHVQSSQVQAAMPIFCWSVRREAAQTCGPSEPLAWGWGKGVCPLGTRETLCLPSGSEFFLPSGRDPPFLRCGVRNSPYGRFNWKPVLGEGQARERRIRHRSFVG